MTSFGIVPAAGKGERFGGRKLLADIDGAPMIERAIRSLLDGGVGSVVVVLAPDSEVSQSKSPAVTALTDRRVRVAVNPDPARGMFSSIQCGFSALTGTADPILVLPGDMPFVRAQTVAAILSAARRGAEPISPTHDGRRGHPLALPACARHALLAADPKGSLTDVLRMLSLPRRELAVKDPGILRDVDTVADVKRH